MIRLVKELRGRGNMAIFGIVDRDDQNRSADGVMVNPEAYTLENLILHPGAIGSLLMRDGELTPESIGLPREVRSYSMDASDLQVAADHIAQAAPDQSRLQTLELVNGTELSMPIWFLNHDGHSLHDWLKEEFPKLRRHNDLMGAVCNLVYGDCPGLVPRSVWDLFNQLGS